MNLTKSPSKRFFDEQSTSTYIRENIYALLIHLIAMHENNDRFYQSLFRQSVIKLRASSIEHTHDPAGLTYVLVTVKKKEQLTC